MRRADMHTSDLVAWRDFRDGYSDPGLIILARPVMTRYGGRYQLNQRGGSKYLLLTPQTHSDGRAIRTVLDKRIEAGQVGPGEDFWGVGHEVAQHVEQVRDQLENGEIVNAQNCPAGWTLALVTGSLIRGAYPELHLVDVAKRRQLDERNAEEDRARVANKARLDKIKARLLERDLPSGMTDRVDFRGWQPAEVNPLVDVPLSLLEMLVDDGER